MLILLHTPRVGAMVDCFVLYRPETRSGSAVRAQSIQVINAAHALACRGHRVELCVEGEGRAADVLSVYGLDPVPSLALRVLPWRRTAASLAYRAAFAAWVARTRGRGVAIARRKRHADGALRWFGGRFSLVIEAHEVDSAAAEGRAADGWRALEARVLAGSRGVVANAEGTLALLRRVHRVLPPSVVIHNAARPAPPPDPAGSGVGVVGSVRPYKDPLTVARAAADVPVTWVGAAGAGEAGAMAEASGGRLVLAPAVPYREVPRVLSRFRVLLVPLSPGLFGERLTSPLKLWDAVASGLPVVAADTPAIRAAVGDAFVPYRPGDPASLRSALRAALDDLALRERVTAAAAARARTWAQRAEEIEAFLLRVAA